MNLPSLYLHDDGGHRNYMYIKEKGSMSSLLIDLMYIQECEDVGFIHFNNLINLYYDDLLLYGLNSFENHPYLKRISEGRKGQFIDWIGTELKLSKVFRCNTVLNQDEVKN